MLPVVVSRGWSTEMGVGGGGADCLLSTFPVFFSFP